MNSSRQKPPRWIAKFLGCFLEPRLLEACLGDLEEKFSGKLKRHVPLWKARLFFQLEALGFLRMARVKNSKSFQTNVNMVHHTILFFIRLVRKDLSYYVVSLLGLTISLVSFIFLMMFITDELSFDKFHTKHNRIYRLTTHLKLNDVSYHEATSQFPAAQVIKSELPEIEHTVRLFPASLTLESGENKFEENILFADNSFFDVFSFQLLDGSVAQAMAEPNSILLTERAAKKYFGETYVVGKLIKMNGQLLEVSAVIEDVPDQSHIKFDAVIPLEFQLNQWYSETGTEGRENKWYWTGAYTYLLLKDESDEQAVRLKLSTIVTKYFPERYKEGGMFQLQALTDIHLQSSLDAELEPGGSLTYLRLSCVVAFVIMIVCAINMINLSYFKTASRLREVGIRKFLGQNTARIVAQLSLESVLMGLLAFSFAVVMCILTLPNFNVLVQKNLHLVSPPNLLVIGGTLIMLILICIIAVIRPAMQYGSLTSGELLLQKHQKSGKSQTRNLLIALQVCSSFVLLTFSLIVSGQIKFFKNKDLGFDKKNMVVVTMNDNLAWNFEAFKTELKKNKNILHVTGADVPGVGYNAWRFVPEGGSYEKPLMLPFTSTDHSFLSTLNIKLIAGSNFESHNTGDSLMSFLINKRAAVELGWQDDVLNKTLEVFAPGTTEIMAKGKVIGLIEDYHFESLHQSVKPLVVTVSPYFSSCLIKLSGAVNEERISAIQEIWKKFSDRPFEYEVLDEKLDKLYSNENKLSNVMLFFTFIALYLTCYGLFAMSSLLFSSKLKEVAVRKIFGADQLSIVKQFCVTYTLFTLGAIIVGLPVAVWIADLWLEGFQYRIQLGVSFFVQAAGVILIAGLLSVSYYVARVAFSNPVRFLRRE